MQSARLGNTEERILLNNNGNNTPAVSTIRELLGCKSTHLDAMLATVNCGECVRDNDGTYLDGEIEDDDA